MMLTNLFSHVLNMSVTAGFVILGVILARFLLKRAPKIFSYLLWAVVLFRLLCPVSVPSPLSAMNFLEANIAQYEGTATGIEYVDTYREVIVKPLPSEPGMWPERPEDAPPSAMEALRQRITLNEIVPWLWLAGASGMMVFGIVSYLRFRKQLICAVPVSHNVYLVDHMDSAFVAGLVRPKIYLPSDIPENEMTYILAHEKCHLDRLDHVTRHLAFLALSIHWFNPLAWAAFILSGKDMEMSCDEAVIQKLGEGIRAEYVSSLLSLATNHKTVFGSPLAFGEGDTKERIMNMTKWKSPQKWVRILSMLLCVTVMTACASNPTEQAVISKNDGSFDANVVQSAGEEQTGGTQNVKYAETFTSTDGSVVFSLDIDTEVDFVPMPVVEVKPHFYTGEDAQRIAQVLMGDADFYEAEPWMGTGENLTRQEILDAIQRWTPYTSKENFADLFPWQKESPEYIEDATQFVKESIEMYTMFLENDSGFSHTPALWRYQLSSQYFYSPEQMEELDVDTSQDVQTIKVTTTRDSIPYQLEFSIRDESDYKLSNLYLSISPEFSPHDLDRYLWNQTMLATEKPTEAQMRQAQEKAQAMLDQMGIGTWMVDDCYLEINTMTSVPEYTIKVTAVPVFEGVPAMRRNQLGNLKSDTAYASSLYLTDATFSFNAQGELVACDIFSPLNVTQVVNSNTAIMSMDELIQRAKKHVALSDMENYGLSGELLRSIQASGEKLQCEINITEMQYGLIRVKVPNTDDSYYYVPGMILSGSVQYVGKDSGSVYMDIGEGLSTENVIPLVAINAVDGSIIELDNPMPA